MTTGTRAASASERVFQWRAGAGSGQCCTRNPSWTSSNSRTTTNGSAPLPYDYFRPNQNQNQNHNHNHRPQRHSRNLVWLNPNLNPTSSSNSKPNPNSNPTATGGNAKCNGRRGNHRSFVWLNPNTATPTPTPTPTSTSSSSSTSTGSGSDGENTITTTTTTTTRADEIAVASNATAASNAGNTPCKQFLSGCCPFADTCHSLHTWSLGKDFSLLTACHGHQKAIQAIQLPSLSDRLYSVTSDGILHTWNYKTGQCAATAHLSGEVGSMLSHGPWLIVGMHDSIKGAFGSLEERRRRRKKKKKNYKQSKLFTKLHTSQYFFPSSLLPTPIQTHPKAGNIQTGAEMYLSGPTGLVSALAADGDLLFAGTQDGRILIWRLTAASNLYEPAACLVGHRLPVVSIIVQGASLYSASLDGTIKEWDLTTLQCVHTLSDHTKGVMSLMFWNQFLISCSLDNTVKVWNKNTKGELELTYTHTEEHGLLGLCGMNDLHGKPVLFASLGDNSVRLFDLPSFEERGRIFAKQEVRAMLTGPDGLFFIGDGTGELKVWQWSTD